MESAKTTISFSVEEEVVNMKIVLEKGKQRQMGKQGIHHFRWLDGWIGRVGKLKDTWMDEKM